jgi:hypothetical protein
MTAGSSITIILLSLSWTLQALPMTTGMPVHASSGQLSRWLLKGIVRTLPS